MHNATKWIISAVRDPELEGAAKRLYSDTLPYHNFRHVLDTLKAADTIIGHCLEEGIRVDEKVVYYALLFHDAGFQENHDALGYECKEAYSAKLAADMLDERGIYANIIGKVTAAILSTRREAKFVSVEQKAVRAADLSGLAGDYETFHKNSRNLKSEYELLAGEALTWAEWVDKAAETIRIYLMQEIRLTSYFTDEDGESAFHQAVRKNLVRLLEERD
jgi:predicted metal-dependent HD superfamily phosphohydrolase